MKSNNIEPYELINGYAIVDNSFNIITANEMMYKYLGMSSHYSVIDSIHQVDLDDFIDVANSLRMGAQKTMCLRMKRVDNSYRWVLIDMHRKSINGIEDTDYLELNISDVIGLKNYNKSLQTTIKSFTHILAMDNELFYTYDYEDAMFTFYTFVDNELFVLMKDTLLNIKNILIERNDIEEGSLSEFDKLCDDILAGKVEYSHTLNISLLNDKSHSYYNTLIKGSTIFNELKPVKSVGSFKTLDNSELNYSKKTNKLSSKDYLTNFDDLEQYCLKNIEINHNCSLSVIRLEIDNIDSYRIEKGNELADKMLSIAIDTILKVIEYRGVLCVVDEKTFGIVLKDTNQEISLRAFLEYIRTRIYWNCRQIDLDYKMRFSIGIVRYPENSLDINILKKKLDKAMEIAKQKGGNRYIIYKEALHGEIEE